MSSDSRARSGVDGQLDNGASSSVELPSSDGVEELLGIRVLASCSNTERASVIFGGGERGVIADFSLSSVGHSLGDGITSAGYRFLVLTRLFTDWESLIGTSPSESLADMSYISSNSLFELLLLHMEVSSEGEPESELSAGARAMPAFAIAMFQGLGVGKSPSSGDASALRGRSLSGGCARRTDT